MASSPSDLTLDYTTAVVENYHVAADQATSAERMHEFVARLEEERLKIDAFKRELPLCMQLLNHAMEAYRHQLEAYQMDSHGATARPPLEFISLKNVDADEKKARASEKAGWMVSAQLWNGPKEHHLDTSAALPELALALDEKVHDDTAGINNGDVVQNGAPSDPTSIPPEGKAVPPQAIRKARRCWSPELHRRFVNALQILGGAQVATPKQIRELMKVHGLTNDEVKSHLQKYRLHTRRPLAAPTAGVPQLVVLGGIWMPPDYASGQAMYGVHYTAAQEYYQSAAVAAHHGHHLQHYQQQHPAPSAMVHHRTVAAPPPAYETTRSSPPESEDGEIRSESIEEEEEDDDMAPVAAEEMSAIDQQQ